MSVESTPKKSIQQEWYEFQTKFRKTYMTYEDSDKRFNIFRENFGKIQLHNQLHFAGRIDHKQGITPFTDWTSEEFSGFINDNKLKLKKRGEKHYFKNNSILPEFVDWRLQGAVSEVKDQGHCGSCWSFSATGAIEGQAKLSLGKLISLSEQNLIDCATEDYGNLGCNGGDTNAAFDYVRDNGIEEEYEYPYVAKQGKCLQKNAKLYVTRYYFVEKNEEALKEAVALNGPISVGIEATVNLQNYAGGVYFDDTCTYNINHGVLVVGYGIENERPYWLIKNSWGSSWGEQGYLKLARNQYNNCQVASMASFPLVKNES
ncbi:hypothetical protein HHI36_014831 [Cryptolaemus montrouzieri]